MKFTKRIVLSIAILTSLPITACHQDDNKDENGNNFIHLIIQLQKTQIPSIKSVLEPLLKRLTPQIKLKQKLINDTNNLNFTPVMSALLVGAYDVISMLAQHGANLNLKTKIVDFKKGYKKMGTAITPLYYCVAAKDTQGISTLLNCGAKVDVLASNGETPLILAIKNKLNVEAKLLLSRGANPKGIKGSMRPLDIAFKFNFPFVFTLLRYGAQPNQQERENLNIACKALLSVTTKNRNSQDFGATLQTILYFNLVPHEELLIYGLSILAEDDVLGKKIKMEDVD